ncbi:MAG: hypothetical protein GXP35_06510, partial [Actinobacteria bacterium]|nr:hypothetical protein [Actinomycetota bacterium]
MTGNSLTNVRGGWACELGCETDRVSDQQTSSDTSIFVERLGRVRAVMAERDIDTILLSVGHDLPYLTGYAAMPLERLTMLVVNRD